MRGHTHLSNNTLNNIEYDTLSNAFDASNNNRYTGFAPFAQ